MNVNEYNLCVDQFSDGVYRFSLKHAGDKDKASDMVQDAFLKLWENVKDISFDKAKSYLFSCTYHAFVDDHRRKNTHKKFVDSNDSSRYFSSEYDNTMDVVQTFLQDLPASQRSVLMLCDYEGYSYAEIAEITQLSESQVKVYIYRARVAMKAKLQSLPYSVMPC